MTYEDKMMLDILWQEDLPNKYIGRIRELIEKEDKYAWHDLRKNPDDLPKDGQRIIVTDGKNYFSGKECGYTCCEVGSRLVIAWREIEPFEGEECLSVKKFLN